MRLKPAYQPTPDQISEAGLRIRQSWSLAEARRRLLADPQE